DQAPGAQRESSARRSLSATRALRRVRSVLRRRGVVLSRVPQREAAPRRGRPLFCRQLESVMKTRILFAVLTVLLTALSASAALETVLTSDSVIYTVDGSAEMTKLQLSRRTADTIAAVIVPGTEDEALEADARLVWDAANTTLFVVWTHRGGDGD